jgi:hypothetical protein
MSVRFKKDGSNSNNPENSDFIRVPCEPSKGFEIGKWAYLRISQEPRFLEVQIQSLPIRSGGCSSRKVWLYHLRRKFTEFEVNESYLAFKEGHAIGN